jgi:hypothetical protein
MPAAWNASGSYFESCNCEVGCPCVFLSAPSHGECTVLLAWHIDKGSFEGQTLDGLNAALAVHAPEHMMKGKWDAALYVDERGKPAQRDALTKVFSGAAGGEPAALAPLIAKVHGVRAVPIEFKSEGKRRYMRIPKVAEMEVEAIQGQGGADVLVQNHPLTAVPNQAAVVAKSKKLTFKDYGLSWNLSDRNGFYSPFAYKGK